MAFFEVYAIGLGIILVLMTLLWLFSLWLKNSSIVDIFWGTGFVIAGWVYFILTPDGYFARKLLISLLVTIWGLRLSLYILWRNWGKPEDFRYQKWRGEAGNKWWWQSFFRVFLLQGVLLWVISAPLLAAQYRALPGYLTIFDFLGVAVWLVGFFFEAMGDFQLSRFKARTENKGKVLDKGFWKYTRHPNYFGDSAVWWGYGLICLSAGSYLPVLGSILMTALIIKVSGVALLEKSLKDQKPQYREYIEKTSAFFPWLPRK